MTASKRNVGHTLEDVKCKVMAGHLLDIIYATRFFGAKLRKQGMREFGDTT